MAFSFAWMFDKYPRNGKRTKPLEIRAFHPSVTQMKHFNRNLYCNPREIDAKIIERNQKADERKRAALPCDRHIGQALTSTEFEKQRIKTGRTAPRTNETFLFDFYQVGISNNAGVVLNDLQCSCTRSNWMQACWWNRSYKLLDFFRWFQMSFDQGR